MNTATVDSQVLDYAQSLAGNWQKFECFAWFNEPEDGEDWAILYTHNRDSGLLTQSNAAVIAKAMEPFMEGDDPDVVAEDHNHWAVSWVAGYAIRCLRDGKPTPAIAKWYELECAMENYPVLDEDDYSSREYEVTIANVEEVVCSELGKGERTDKEGETDQIASEVFSWLWKNDQGELESTDDQGGYPSSESVQNALVELGYLEEDTEEDDEG